MIALHFRGNRTDHAAEGPTRGAAPRSDTVTGMPRSQHTEAISDPMKPAPMMRTRFVIALKCHCENTARLAAFS